MAARILIGEGADQHIISENGRFDLQIRSSFNEAGKVDVKEVFIEIEGDLVKSTAALVWDEAALKWDEILNKLAARRVQIELDGVVKPEFDWTPASTIAGTPQVSRCRLKATEGAGDSHWGFELSIYVKLLGNAGGGDMPNIYELSTSITTTYVEDRPVRKEWFASGKGATIASALAAIKNFKPSESKVIQILKREFEEARATGTWIWEASRIYRIEEDIDIVGAGRDYEADVQVDTPTSFPELHESPYGPVEITISGTIWGPTKDIQAPAPHFSAGGNMVRAGARERNGLPVTYDVDRGQWKRRFMEVWISRDGAIGTPNHSDHAVIKKLSEPAD